MTDKDFFDFVFKKTKEFDGRSVLLNEKARIALVFEKTFKSTFLRFLENHKSADDFWFCRKNVLDILDMSSDIDIRNYMTEELINETAKRGFVYRQDLSNFDVLIFNKGL